MLNKELRLAVAIEELNDIRKKELKLKDFEFQHLLDTKNRVDISLNEYERMKQEIHDLTIERDKYKNFIEELVLKINSFKNDKYISIEEILKYKLEDIKLQRNEYEHKFYLLLKYGIEEGELK